MAIGLNSQVLLPSTSVPGVADTLTSIEARALDAVSHRRVERLTIERLAAAAAVS
jgi:hypothetical protein